MAEELKSFQDSGLMPENRNFSTHTYQTLSGLRTHPLWKQLTPKQQNFLSEFLKTGNRIAAAQSAFNCKDEKSASTLASRLLKMPVIQTLLSIYSDYQEVGGPFTKKELLQALSNRMRRKDTSAAAFVRMAEILAEMAGWIKQQRPAAEETEPNLDALVREMEKQNERQRDSLRREAEES